METWLDRVKVKGGHHKFNISQLKNGNLVTLVHS